MSKQESELPLSGRNDGVERTIRYRRGPTKAEIRFGYGATHYREFPHSECYDARSGRLRRRFKAKDDGLWYSRA